jgi:3-oxoacyl-[acyl-carrier-protein] synthase-1
MVSSLGPNAVSSCAAARAGVLRATPLDEFLTYEPESGEMVPVFGHQVRELTLGFTGLGRMARLADAALQDLCTGPEWDRSGSARTGLFLALPSGYFESSFLRAQAQPEDYEPLSLDEYVEAALGDGRRALLEQLVPLLAKRSGLRLLVTRLYFEDQTGAMSAVREAAENLRSGKLDRCIVGGVDTLCDPALIEPLLLLGMLKTPESPARFLPGEAAAFVLLERASAETTNGAALGTLEAPVTTEDPVHRFAEDPVTGSACADAVRRCQGRLPDQGKATGLLITDLNGDEWKARRWGHTLTVLPRELVDVPHWYTGESFGEIGAATVPVAICMALRAFQRGYANAEGVLVSASAYAGPSGALHVRAPGGAGVS